MTELKAKVFISCGQRKDSDEVAVANAISKTLEAMGFETYIAVQEQTLSGLKENIYSRLSASEYFLFIDFLREQLIGNREHRGSLFSNQELAIASYLGLEVIAFQQKGIKPLDGMIGAIQLNPIIFDDPKALPKLVEEQVKRVGWRADWKNALVIIKNEEEYYQDTSRNTPDMTRFFHLEVKNLNIRKIALNCTAFLESIIKLPENESLPLRTIELKWAGYILPTVSIIPKSYRNLDAFFVKSNEPRTLQFRCFSDSPFFMTPIEGLGKYRLNYVVISENFPEARIAVEATIGNSIDDAMLVQI